MEDSTLMVSGPPAQPQPLVGPGIEPLISAADVSLPLALPSDMMSKFEALSRVFRAEVEGLVDQEKAASRETSEQLHARITDLEEALDAQTGEACAGAARVRAYLQHNKRTWIEQVFADPDPPEFPEVTVAGFRDIVEVFVQMSEASRDPELDLAGTEISQLKQQVAARDAELATLRDDLREAQILKSQEERDLAEFCSLREKESDLQEANLKIRQLQSQFDELQSTQKILLSRASQSEAALGDKSRKIVNLMKQVEQDTEQCRLLANENNTLRLHLGKDSDYMKVVKAPTDPLSFTSSAGVLCDKLQGEEQRLRTELSTAVVKFPGLATGGENCRSWCEAQISRQCSLYRSFLHLLQDFSQDTPGELDIDFVSKTREVDDAWLQREEEMRDSDAVFHDNEKELTKKWEEKRLELTAERDTKIKQLTDQADRSQTRAEKQLLMQQAKLFGQRMDTQIERAWEDQRKERDERWAEHNKAKHDSRQKFKDKSMMMQQEAEGLVSAADRFQDMARARLAGPEDAWTRNIEKMSTVSASALKGQGLQECLKAAGLQAPTMPREGTQFGGITAVADSVEDLLRVRVHNRQSACKELEDQTLQQLRHCVERFIQHEGTQQQKKVLSLTEDAAATPEHSHATTIQSLLYARQHRVVADTMRRHFHDFMIVLRVASLAALHLLPHEMADKIRSHITKLDLPAVPQELMQEFDISGQAEPSKNGAQQGADQQGIEETSALPDEEVEGKFMYDTLMRRLLERLLTPMHNKHREELLLLKRAHFKEIRQCLQHLCQLDPASVDKSSNMDVEEYKAQITSKLLADCEYHVCEERRQLSEQIDDEVALHVGVYERQVAEEERIALRERRKWLTERLVVIQSQGAGSPGDRAVIQHLRSELRACELRFEMRDQELMDGDKSYPEHQLAAQTDNLKPQQVTKDVASSDFASGKVRSPAAPSTQPPQNRRPSRGNSPKPANDMTFPIGRASGGGATSAHDTKMPGCSRGDSAGGGSPSYALPDYSPQIVMAAATPLPRPRAAEPQSLSDCSPRSANGQTENSARMSGQLKHSPSFGADGAAGFGREPSHCPSFGDDNEGAFGPIFGEEPETYTGSTLLEDWPFAGSEMMCDMAPKPSNERQKQKAAQSVSGCGMPEFLPPLKPPLARPLPADNIHEVGSYSAGISLGAVHKGSGFKSPRLMPQVLPPMISPRPR